MHHLRPVSVTAAAVTAGALLSGGLTGAAHAATASDPPRQRAPKVQANCFWLGPISTDVRSSPPERFDGRSFNFPEESATYWLARYRLNPGQRLVLHGRYPHARYLSLSSYAQGGTSVFSVPDIAIRPDRGSRNPFLPGARRDSATRKWTLNVVDAAAPTRPARNTLYAPSTSTSDSEIVLRIYEPDRGHNLTGGAGLPRPKLVNPDGSRIRGVRNVCRAVNGADRTIASTVQSIPKTTWQSLVRTPGPAADPATSPAFRKPQWERFFNTVFATGVFAQAAGNPRPTPAMDDVGGFYSNRDARYILTHLSRRFGQTVVLRGRMPVTPQTYQGQKRMTRGQVRFWSLCSGQSRVTTRTPDCLADRQVPLHKNRKYVIVVSKAVDRPSNARRSCGIGWLNWGTRGDGAGRPAYGFLLMRNMLASRGFDQAIQNITRFGAEADVMGKYFPALLTYLWVPERP